MTMLPGVTVLDLRGAIIPLILLKVSQVFQEAETVKTMEIKEIL